MGIFGNALEATSLFGEGKKHCGRTKLVFDIISSQASKLNARRKVFFSTNGGRRVGKAEEGDRFIKPDSKRIYVVTKVVINGDWVILKEENGDHQILTSQESLRTWINAKKEERG